MARGELIEERLTHSVIGAFYEVYVIVTYKGEELGRQRIDLIVDNTLVVEIKSTQSLHESATRQIYNYLKATNLAVGLLLHFGPKPTFHRIICRTPRPT